MLLKEIVEKLQELKVYEKREITDDFCELVFLNEDIDACGSVLECTLGAAVKPSGEQPTKEDGALTEKYGGIFKNQTLYKKEEEGAIIIGMFWPWQDNKHTTLKLFTCQESDIKETKKSFWNKLFG